MKCGMILGFPHRELPVFHQGAEMTWAPARRSKGRRNRVRGNRGVRAVSKGFGDPDVDDAGLQGVALLTKLTSLNLDCKDVTDLGLFHLMPLVNLRRLDLFNARISDAGCRYLMCALSCSRPMTLHVLCFQKPGFGD